MHLPLLQPAPRSPCSQSAVLPCPSMLSIPKGRHLSYSDCKASTLHPRGRGFHRTGIGVWACGWANSTHLQLFNDVHITPSFNLLATCTIHTLAINCSCGGAVHLFRGRSWELCSQLPPIMGTSRRQPMFMLIHVCIRVHTYTHTRAAPGLQPRLPGLWLCPTHQHRQCATCANNAPQVRQWPRR